MVLRELVVRARGCRSSVETPVMVPPERLAIVESG